MKYYTKKWYQMLHNAFHLEMFKIVPDEKYSEEKICSLYEKKLEKRMEEERRFCDEPSHILSLYDKKHKVNDSSKNETGNKIQSLEESKESMEAEFLRKALNGQNTFDPSAAAENFKAAYESSLRMVHYRYPEWVENEADPRLLAMGFMPEGIYKRLKQQEKENRKAFKIIDRKAKKETDIQWSKVPARIREIFRFGSSPALEEALLLSFDSNAHDISFVFRYGAWQKPPENTTPFICITFQGAELLENEMEIQFLNESPMETETDATGRMYIADELYFLHNCFYEYHLMLSDLSYITILCKNIVCQQNYKPPWEK